MKPVKMINPERIRRNKTMIISEDRKAWLTEKIKWNYSIFGTLPLDVRVSITEFEAFNDGYLDCYLDHQYIFSNKDGIVDLNEVKDVKEIFTRETDREFSGFFPYVYKNLSIKETTIISLNDDNKTINISSKNEYSTVENMRNEINTISNEGDFDLPSDNKFIVVAIFPLVKCAPMIRIYSKSSIYYYIDDFEKVKELVYNFSDKNCIYNSIYEKSTYTKTIVNFEKPATGYPMSYNGKVDDILKVCGNENFYEKDNERVLETKDGLKVVLSDDREKELSYNDILFSGINRENKKSFVFPSPEKSKYLKDIDDILKNIEYPFVKSCKEFIEKSKNNETNFVDIDTNYIKGSYSNLPDIVIIEVFKDFNKSLLKCMFANTKKSSCDNDSVEVIIYSYCLIDLNKDNKPVIMMNSGTKIINNSKQFRISSEVSRLGGVFIYEKYINDANGDTILKSDSIDGSFVVHLDSMDSNIIRQIEKFESPIYSINDKEIYIRDEYSVPKKYIISDEARR